MHEEGFEQKHIFTDVSYMNNKDSFLKIALIVALVRFNVSFIISVN